MSQSRRGFLEIGEAKNLEPCPLCGRQNWVSVKDRMPENDGLYLVCYLENGIRYIGFMDFKDQKFIAVFDGYGEKVQYWTHMPYFPFPLDDEA